MDYCDFRRLAVDSAQRYFQYLVKGDKGIIITEVSSIEKIGEEAFLHLRGRLSPAGLESLKLRIYADEFDTWEIVPVEYHSESGVLVLHPQKAIYERFPSGLCKHISIISDLRFLVERVRNWYDKDRPPLVLPAQAPCVALPLPPASRCTQWYSAGAKRSVLFGCSRDIARQNTVQIWAKR